MVQSAETSKNDLTSTQGVNALATFINSTTLFRKLNSL